MKRRKTIYRSESESELESEMKKAIIEVRLVDEANEVENQQIEKEISEELSRVIIPWCKRVEKVTVTEET